MKNKFLSSLAFISLLFSLSGCEGFAAPQGVRGPQGEQGEPGKDGEDGTNGKDGKDGTNGDDGLSAYEIFLKYHPEYTGSEEDWINDVASGNTCNLFGHEWDEGVITTEPTKGADGEKTYSCANCDEHKYETLPKIEVANAEIYEVDGVKYVNYGSYPQTHVGDETLISELNELTEINYRGYYEYNGKEYAKITAKPYHYGSYKDEYGETKYHQYTDGSIIEKYTTEWFNVVEWFNVEPIKWRIISENVDGSYQLYSEYVLDATSYCDYDYLRKINEVDIYQNNYKYSNIRAWLNGYNGTEYKITDYTNKGFVDVAFKEEEKGAIVTTEVDNSASTTSSSTNQYACENTFDKIYLLSYKDMRNINYGFGSSIDDLETRYAQVTDYAKANGVYWDYSTQYFNNGYYWLRSPDYYLSYYYAISVGFDGSFYDTFDFDDTDNGVRAACNINLE